MGIRAAIAVIATIAAAAASAGVPAPAGAVPPPLVGPAWPGGVVRYHDATPPPMRPFVRAAARQWHGSGLRVRFVPVGPARADVVVTGRHAPRGQASAGVATLGAAYFGFVYLALGARDPQVATAVAVHELGHVLGLGHAASGGECSLMRPVLDLRGCPRPPQADLALCRFIFPADVRRLASRYGLRRPPDTRPAFCPAGARPMRPRPPERLAGAWRDGGAGSHVRITWARWPAAPGRRRADVRRHAGPCADAAAGGGEDIATRRDGAYGLVDPHPPAGPAVACYEIAASTVNERGVGSERFGMHPARVRVEVAIPGPPA